MEAWRLALVKSIYYRIIESWLHEVGPSIFNFRRHFFNWDLLVLDWDT